MTEFSWDTSPPDPRRTARLHARWVAEALYRMWSAGVGLSTWFTLRDGPFGAAGRRSRLASISPEMVSNKIGQSRRSKLPLPIGSSAREGPRRRLGPHTDVEPGGVVAERRLRGGWRRLATVRANRHGIFQRTFRMRPGAISGHGLPTTNSHFRLPVRKPRPASLPFGTLPNCVGWVAVLFCISPRRQVRATTGRSTGGTTRTRQPQPGPGVPAPTRARRALQVRPPFAGCSTSAPARATSQPASDGVPAAEILGIGSAATPGSPAARRRCRMAFSFSRDLSRRRTRSRTHRGWATHAACSEVLEHVTEPVAAASHARAYLAPGCTLVVTVPGRSDVRLRPAHRAPPAFLARRSRRLLVDAGFVVERASAPAFRSSTSTAWR